VPFPRPRVAAQRRERIGRKRHETLQRQAPRDVLDVRVQASVFVNHQHGRQLGSARAGRARQVAVDAARAAGRGIVEPFDCQPRIVLRNLLAGCKVRAQRGEQARSAQARLGEPLRLREKPPPVQAAVDVSVKQEQQLLVKIPDARAWRHGAFPFEKNLQHTPMIDIRARL